MKCPYCKKIIWPWQEKQYTNALDKERVYHIDCYWEKFRKSKESGLEEVK